MRQLILDAALKMFLEVGYAKTSIRNIADSIEYSPGTIYLYYKDKDELLYGVQHQAYAKLLEVFQKKAKDKNPAKRLREICQAYIEFGLKNPGLYDLMFIIRSPMNVDETIHKTNGGNCLGYLSQCVAECIEQKLIKFEDAKSSTLQVWSLAHGLVSLDIRCRLRVMIQDENAVYEMLGATMNNYLDMVINK